MSRESRQEVETRIQRIILTRFREGVGEGETLPIDTPLIGKGMGLDSLDAMALAMDIESEFGIVIDDDELTVDLFETIGTLAAHVRKLLHRNGSCDRHEIAS